MITRVCLTTVSAFLSITLTANVPHPKKEATMELKTPAFPQEGSIPKRFTADGADVSPALSWHSAPAQSQAFALIMEDPDAPAGLWTHWTVYDIPAKTSSLAENQAKAPVLGDGSKQGKNTWGRLGYNGPAPPPGKPHRYFFKLYALSTPLGINGGATRQELDAALKGRVLAEAIFMARYGR
jgi:Raf kinase inhibitor-like YbhB/YbcL family protein